MKNNPENEEFNDSLTPSTRKLHQLLAKRDLNSSRMLTAEEIDLLRKSQREMSETFAKLSKSNFFGMLTDKTNHVASLDEIKNAISDGWAGIDKEK